MGGGGVVAWACCARCPVLITIITITITIIIIIIVIIIVIIITTTTIITIMKHAGPLTRAAARPGGTRARGPGAGP